MIEGYLLGLIIMGGFGAFALILAALVHSEFRDADSAGKVKGIALFTASSVIWPIVLVFAMGYMIFCVAVGLYDAFTRF